MYTADFFISKYAKEAAGGKFYVSLCVRKELPCIRKNCIKK